MESNEKLSKHGGRVNNMLWVRVCAIHMGGFLGPKFSKQGSLFRQIFLKHGWVFQKLAKNSQNGLFSAQIHHKSGYDSKFRKSEGGTFLNTGRQTPIHPQVMYFLPGCTYGSVSLYRFKDKATGVLI